MQKLLRARCVLLGSKSCGKSSIIQSFRDDGREFSYNYRMSATVELIVKTLTVPELSDGIELFLYDIPGEEIFRDFMEHYKEAVGIDAIFSYLIQQYYQLYTDAAQHYKSLV
ncbi:Intraflagellar transport protein 27 like [Schistosoma japonicum]|nr:Intraflagellar transport protein 27 like [Schistosoma japonicum]